ncbi:nuclear GTPase SLIP-GC-like isoform X2 [Triplophysa dalaica]|nr:nuclear GTPase SLIP-GC-like isoform X2 [Triplophysa dalaica]
MKQTKDIIKNIHSKIPDEDSTHLKSYIAQQILNMDKMNKSNKNRKKIALGVFGRSGEGKSSLLCAVLGERYLLPSGSSGACTAITTQVEANLCDSNYAADIEFISKEDWDDQFKDLLLDLSDECEDKNDDINKIAIEKITALYGANAHKKKYDDLRKDARSADIDKLLLMKEKIISKVNTDDFAKEISYYIQHTYSKSNTGGWYWPLVKSVTIKIPNCQELLEHIVLVDLPGTGDCNKIRDNLWKSKLRECSSVWIVSGIHRAISDEDPWEILKQCIYHMTQAGECKSIKFICTKSDDIDPEEYTRNEWPTDEEVPDRDLKAACIRKRNISAKETVRESFENSKLKKKMSLNVFTVSSRAFFDKTLHLERSDTEIPQLQDVLRNLNNSVKRELARDYVNEAKGILALICVQSDTDENMVHKEFEKNLSKALERLDCQFDVLRCVLEQCLTYGVEDSQSLCLKSARSIISPDLPHGNRGFHRILKAMCNNNGYHWSKAWNRDLDLNMELAQQMHKNIEEEFDSIFPVHGKTGKSVQEQIDKFSVIQSDTEDPSSNMLHHTENFIKTEENKLKIKLKREVVERKKDIHLSIQMTIKDAMAPYYKRAAKFTGTGSMKKMQSTLTEGIENLKHEMFKDAKDKVLEEFSRLEEYIKEALNSGIQSSIRLLLSGKITMPDISKHTTELENLLKQLSD